MYCKILFILMISLLSMNAPASFSLSKDASLAHAMKKHKSVADGWVKISQKAKNLNVHSISKNFIRNALPNLYVVDKTLRGEVEAMTWADFQTSLESFDVSFDKMGAKIKNYYGTVDNESLADMAILMTRVWSLAQLFEDGPINFQINIESNIYEGGGCCAGVAVRLTQLYTSLLGQLIEAHRNF